MVENVRRLHHFDHKGRLPAVDLVAGADAGKNAIHHANARGIGRHKGADLRQQRDQRGLAQKGAFARHVGAGQQVDACFRRQVRIVRHKWLVGQHQLDHGMPPARDLDAGAFVHLWAYITVGKRDLGQRGIDIKLCQCRSQRQ